MPKYSVEEKRDILEHWSTKALNSPISDGAKRIPQTVLKAIEMDDEEVLEEVFDMLQARGILKGEPGIKKAY